jgi:phage terminase large subunit-like protein
MIERAQTYISDVLSGKIISGKWLRLALERHIKDLGRVGSHDFPFYFDEEEAERVLSLYSLFRFSKGAETGKPFDVMPWWAAVVYLAYGWRRDGGGKRFRKVYVKVARGNAKTANLVTIGTIGFLFEGVNGAEVYWVATVKEQAKIGWDRQRVMLKMLVEDEPELQSLINIPKGHNSTKISRTDQLSWVSYLGRESDTEDGASPYYVLVDEYHAWDNDDRLNVLESGLVKSNLDPMTWIITTAGHNPLGPNSEFLRACKNVLQGITENEELLAFIYELDEGDDWKDENLWIKANPGLGISLTMTGLQTEFNKIKSQGIRKEIDFKVKNLNMEHAGESGWIADEDWMLCADEIDFEALKGRECWGGLDLANTNDFNAFVLFFPANGDEKAVLLPFYWIPEASVEKHKVKRPFIDKWIHEGILRTTPGEGTDYEILRQDIIEICEPYMVQAIGFDRQLSSYLTPALIQDGFRMEVFVQSWQWVTPAAKHIEHMVIKRLFTHAGHPILRWNMANVSMQRSDRNDNYLPSKGKSADKIDGISASLNAIGQWLKERGEVQATSYLLEEDMIII